jgi:glucose dehydrogenase
MRNEGLFTPPGFEETVSLPGARGGSNWGTSAANPSKGLVYLTTQDWPTIYKLSIDDPLAARTRARQAAQHQTARRFTRRDARHVTARTEKDLEAGRRARWQPARTRRLSTDRCDGKS